MECLAMLESIAGSIPACAFSCPSTQHAPGSLAFTKKPDRCREEGSNGDREMAAAVYAAGLEPWDISMSDLLMGRATLDSFAGIVFVGGFSYADVLDSAKGWAGTIRRNGQLWQQFQAFYGRQALSWGDATIRQAGPTERWNALCGCLPDPTYLSLGMCGAR